MTKKISVVDAIEALTFVDNGVRVGPPMFRELDPVLIIEKVNQVLAVAGSMASTDDSCLEDLGNHRFGQEVTRLFIDSLRWYLCVAMQVIKDDRAAISAVRLTSVGGV